MKRRHSFLFLGLLVVLLVGMFPFFQFVPMVKAASETRYLANQTWATSVYNFSLAQTVTKADISVGVSAAYEAITIYAGIKIYVLTDAYASTLISGSTPVAIITKTLDSTTDWAANTTWTHNANYTDGKGVKVEVYSDTSNPPTTLRATFVTENMTSFIGISSSEWMVYYTGRATLSGATHKTTAYFSFGSSTYNARITGFEVTTASVLDAIFVNSFTATETDWVEAGGTPYLGNNTDYITPYYAAIYESWFGFEKTNKVVQQASLMLYANGEGNLGTQKKLNLTITLDNGAANYTYNTVISSYASVWTEINITDSVNTKAKANNVRMRILANEAGGLTTPLKIVYIRLFNGPYYYSVDCSEVRAGRTSTFSVWVNDPTGLSHAIMTSNATGSDVNTTLALSGTQDWAAFNVTQPNDATLAISTKYYFNDTGNNWEKTEIDGSGSYVYYLINTDFDEDYLHNVGLAGSHAATQHSLGRNIFYAEDLNIYLMTWCNGTHHVYASSIDGGLTYNVTGSIRVQSGAGNGFWYESLESRGGTYYLHYQYSNESYDMFYRRGVLNADGTLTFSTAEYVVLAWNSSSFAKICPNGITTDSDGHVFLQYVYRITGESNKLNVTCSNATDGTWVTHTGYPLQLDVDEGDTYSFEAFLVPMPESYGVMSVYCQNRTIGWTTNWNYGFQLYAKKITASVVGSQIELSTTNMTEYRHFSATSDSDGNVYAVYVNESNYVLYAKWNYTTENVDVSDEYIWTLLNVTSATYFPAAQSLTLGGGLWQDFPIISYDTERNTTYVNWFSTIEQTGWFAYWNGSAWAVQRSLVMPAGFQISWDPNMLSPNCKAGFALYSFHTQNYTSGLFYEWAVLLTEVPRTSLVIGWTNFTVWTIDIGKTLEQICANLQFNSIESSIIIKYNGTEYRYDYGLEPNVTVLISVASDELRIYSATSGDWFHDYSNFYYRKSSPSQTVSLAMAAPKLIELSKTVSQAITAIFSVSRLTEMLRGVSQTITTSLSASRLTEWITTVTMLIGFALATSRFAEFSGSATQGFSLGLGVGRVAELAKSVSQAISVSLNGQRMIDVLRSASQTITLTLQGIGERIALYLRDAALTITTSLQASRLAEWLKTVSQTISLAFGSVRLGDWFRSVSQSITTSLTANRLIDIARTTSLLLGISVVTLKLAQFVRTSSQTLSFGFVTNGVADFFRSVSQAITATLNVQRLIEVSKQVSQAITFSLQAIGERVGIYARNAVLTITLTLEGSRLAEWFKTVAQSVSFTLETARFSQFVRSASQAISAMLNGERMIELLRSASQTITLTLVGIGDKTGIYLRNVALTIATAFQGSRLAEWLKSVSQNVFLSLGSTGLAEFVRTASQTIVLAFGSVGEKLGNYVANVALTITTTLQTSRRAEWIRQATQTLTLSLSTSRIAELLGIAVLTITTAFNATHLIDLLRQASQSISFLFNGERLIEVSRAASQNIMLTVQGIGEQVGNYFRSVLLNVAMIISSVIPPPTYSQAYVAAAFIMLIFIGLPLTLLLLSRRK